MKNNISIINIICFSFIIILFGINEYKAMDSSVKILLNVILVILGICVFLINLKEILTRHV
ncbi:hypothetical protein [Clostridium sp.]|uniref:hypothetical protein n=1 Tax=Clostridium sp. TaxID=1506 RepID=UPI0025D0FFA5|nr:hypothetical protein [Clostridium sp.]MDY2632283.1 hypothetical protein [Clostridium sp.]